MKAKIISTGSFLPEKIVLNEDLKQFPENSFKLIEAKTGIKARRHAQKDECTSDLAIKAAEKCLKRIDFDPLRIDAIILSTSSPDRIQPATATRIQQKIGALQAFAFDINSVCSGSVYGIYLADALIRSGMCNCVLLVASEVYSKFLNMQDFATYPYFGDGAGAVLFEKNDTNSFGVIASLLKTDGSGADLVQIPAGGTRLPNSEIKNQKDAFFQMDGKSVYSFATTKAPEIINEILAQTGTARNDIRYVISHQANINIIKEISAKTGINFDRFVINLDKYGNTASASILIGLDELLSFSCHSDPEPKAKGKNLNHDNDEGDLILTVGFGGGLSWGTNLISLSKIKGENYAETIASNKSGI